MSGVSPAYFISRFTDRFTPEQVASSLRDLKAGGFDAFQLEVYHDDTLPAWLGGGADRVLAASRDQNLAASQFVAHFLLEAFRTPDRIRSEYGRDEIRKVIDIVSRFDECRLVTVPLPALGFDRGELENRAAWDALYGRTVEKIAAMLETVTGAGMRMALEIMPGSIAYGTMGFLDIRDRIGSAELGYNFDTGHALARKENVLAIPAMLQGMIFGTHLCDNFGNENLSLRPGEGAIDWNRLIPSLEAAGYRGSWDIEIVCPADTADAVYRSGRQFIESIMHSKE